MPILGVIDSGKSGHLSSYSSIATQTVGSGGASSITFNSIPSTYTHLQIRMLARATDNNTIVYGRFNGSGVNYARHNIYANGSSATANATTSTDASFFGTCSPNAVNSSMFGTSIIDILDYANTNKNKTVRSLAGSDHNATAGFDGWFYLQSGLWADTSAINSINLFAGAGSFAQYSSFALYGVK
jgi:hypothetical protein